MYPTRRHAMRAWKRVQQAHARAAASAASSATTISTSATSTPASASSSPVAPLSTSTRNSVSSSSAAASSTLATAHHRHPSSATSTLLTSATTATPLTTVTSTLSRRHYTRNSKRNDDERAAMRRSGIPVTDKDAGIKANSASTADANIDADADADVEADADADADMEDDMEDDFDSPSSSSSSTRLGTQFMRDLPAAQSFHTFLVDLRSKLRDAPELTEWEKRDIRQRVDYAMRALQPVVDEQRVLSRDEADALNHTLAQRVDDGTATFQEQLMELAEDIRAWETPVNSSAPYQAPPVSELAGDTVFKMDDSTAEYEQAKARYERALVESRRKPKKRANRAPFNPLPDLPEEDDAHDLPDYLSEEDWEAIAKDDQVRIRQHEGLMRLRRNEEKLDRILRMQKPSKNDLLMLLNELDSVNRRDTPLFEKYVGPKMTMEQMQSEMDLIWDFEGANDPEVDLPANLAKIGGVGESTSKARRTVMPLTADMLLDAEEAEATAVAAQLKERYGYVDELDVDEEELAAAGAGARGRGSRDARDAREDEQDEEGADEAAEEVDEQDELDAAAEEVVGTTRSARTLRPAQDVDEDVDEDDAAAEAEEEAEDERHVAALEKAYNDENASYEYDPDVRAGEDDFDEMQDVADMNDESLPLTFNGGRAPELDAAEAYARRLARRRQKLRAKLAAHPKLSHLVAPRPAVAASARSTPDYKQLVKQIVDSSSHAYTAEEIAELESFVAQSDASTREVLDLLEARDSRTLMRDEQRRLRELMSQQTELAESLAGTTASWRAKQDLVASLRAQFKAAGLELDQKLVDEVMAMDSALPEEDAEALHVAEMDDIDEKEVGNLMSKLSAAQRVVPDLDARLKGRTARSGDAPADIVELEVAVASDRVARYLASLQVQAEEAMYDVAETSARFRMLAEQVDQDAPKLLGIPVEQWQTVKTSVQTLEELQKSGVTFASAEDIAARLSAALSEDMVAAQAERIQSIHQLAEDDYETMAAAARLLGYDTLAARLEEVARAVDAGESVSVPANGANGGKDERESALLDELEDDLASEADLPTAHEHPAAEQVRAELRANRAAAAALSAAGDAAAPASAASQDGESETVGVGATRLTKTVDEMIEEYKALSPAERDAADDADEKAHMDEIEAFDDHVLSWLPEPLQRKAIKEWRKLPAEEQKRVERLGRSNREEFRMWLDQRVTEQSIEGSELDPLTQYYIDEMDPKVYNAIEGAFWHVGRWSRDERTDEEKLLDRQRRVVKRLQPDTPDTKTLLEQYEQEMFGVPTDEVKDLMKEVTADVMNDGEMEQQVAEWVKETRTDIEASLSQLEADSAASKLSSAERERRIAEIQSLTEMVSRAQDWFDRQNKMLSLQEKENAAARQLLKHWRYLERPSEKAAAAAAMAADATAEADVDADVDANADANADAEAAAAAAAGAGAGAEAGVEGGAGALDPDMAGDEMGGGAGAAGDSAAASARMARLLDSPHLNPRTLRLQAEQRERRSKFIDHTPVPTGSQRAFDHSYFHFDEEDFAMMKRLDPKGWAMRGDVRAPISEETMYNEYTNEPVRHQHTLSEDTRRALYLLHKSNPSVWTPGALATKFRISHAHVRGLLLIEAAFERQVKEGLVPDDPSFEERVADDDPALEEEEAEEEAEEQELAAAGNSQRSRAARRRDGANKMGGVDGGKVRAADVDGSEVQDELDEEDDEEAPERLRLTPSEELELEETAEERRLQRHLRAMGGDADRMPTLLEDEEEEDADAIPEDMLHMLPRLPRPSVARLRWVSENDLHAVQEEEREIEERFLSKQKRMLKRESEEYAQSGPTGASPDMSQVSVQTLVGSTLVPPPNYHITLTDITELPASRFAVAVRDVTGVLRTPTPFEFMRVRRREKDPKARFVSTEFRVQGNVPV